MSRILIRIFAGIFFALLLTLAVIFSLANIFWGEFFNDANWYPIRHTAALIQYIVDNTPLEEIYQERDYLQEVLNRRINIVPSDDEAIPEVIKERLLDGQLLYDSSKEGGNLFYAPVHQGTHLVLIDPSFRQYESRFNLLSVFKIWISVSIAAAFIGLWLTYPIARRLKVLEAATEQIRHGNMTTRIQIASADLIGNVGKCFNQMADRIQSLVTNRQNLQNTVVQKFQVPLEKIDGQLKELHGETSMSKIKALSQKIDAAVNDIEILVGDLLIDEKIRHSEYSRMSSEIRTTEMLHNSAAERQKKDLKKHTSSAGTARSMLQTDVLKFISRMSLGVFIILLLHQLIMIAIPQIDNRYGDIDPTWYPVNTMATLIQRAVNRTPQEELQNRLEAQQANLNRRLDLVTVEEASHFIKTIEQEFIDQMAYGVFNGRNVFFAPIHTGAYALLIDPASSMYQRNPSFLLHFIMLIIEFILTVLFGIFMSLSIIRNLKKLVEGIERIRQDDLNARVDIPLNKPIGKLASCFNGMAERIQSLLEHQKHLIQAVVHEIRTPVSRIRFHLEMLTHTADKPEIKKRAGNIKEEIEELSLLVNELSTLTTLDTMKENLAPLSIPLYDALSEIVACYRKIHVQIDILLLNAAENNLNIIAHPIYFKRAIQNILSNAVRHAHDEVSVSFSPAKDGVCIDICDDGPGIPEHAREKVFEPFTRLDGSRSRKSGGFGLGLAIVKRILSLHDGSVLITDNTPRGTKITTFWPAANPS